MLRCASSFCLQSWPSGGFFVVALPFVTFWGVPAVFFCLKAVLPDFLRSKMVVAMSSMIPLRVARSC